MELDVINGGDKSPTHAIEADLDNLYAGVKMQLSVSLILFENK